MKSEVNFNYTFSTPHRLCVSMPEGSKKLLCDAYPDHIGISWSDDDLTMLPYGAFRSPRTNWFGEIIARCGSAPMKGVGWRRKENRLPVFEYRFAAENAACFADVSIASGEECDIIRLSLQNQSDAEVTMTLTAALKKGVIFNLLWMEPGTDYNALIPTMGDRSDRLLLFAVGGNLNKPRSHDGCDVQETLAPRQEKVCFFVRPHKEKIDRLPDLMKQDYETIYQSAVGCWQLIIQAAPKLTLPDKGVEDAFYAALCDIFLMREKMSDGRIAGIAGTEVYRAMNTCEPVIGCIILAQCGMLEKSAECMAPLLDIIDEKTGRWDDFRLWGHHMYWMVAYRCLWSKEYYQITGDRELLARWYSNIYRHSAYVRKLTESTRNAENPLHRGLIPRAMGDGGLMDDDDYYGIFYAHSVMHVAVLKIGAWEADELGKPEEAALLRKWAAELAADVIFSLRNGGAIEENGFRWIPGVPAKTSGSRFSALWLSYASGIVEPQDELITGTLRYLESNLSEGGMPLDLGWLKGGLWMAMALDQLSYAHIERGEYDAAADYLLPTLNHGTPFYSWCEERLPEANAEKVTGDRQHLWTPVAVGKFLRDTMVFEETPCGQSPIALRIAMTTMRSWLAEDGIMGIENAVTAFGKLSYSITRSGKTVQAVLSFDGSKPLPKQIFLHIRLPKPSVLTLKESAGCAATLDGEICRIIPMQGCMKLSFTL